MKKLLFCILLLIVGMIACKKDEFYNIYSKGTQFNYKAGSLSDLNQTGADMNTYESCTCFPVNAFFTPTEPFTIDSLCDCYISEQGYYVHSANNQKYEMPETSMKILK